jgi:hypothetical protein
MQKFLKIFFLSIPAESFFNIEKIQIFKIDLVQENAEPDVFCRGE